MFIIYDIKFSRVVHFKLELSSCLPVKTGFLLLCCHFFVSTHCCHRPTSGPGGTRHWVKGGGLASLH